VKNEDVGRYYRDARGDLWRLITYCEHPTATMKRVGTGEQCGGAVGSPILAEFSPIPNDDHALVETVIDQMEGRR
jgi:hypothetical protein